MFAQGVTLLGNGGVNIKTQNLSDVRSFISFLEWVSLGHPKWSAVVQSQLTKALDPWAESILLLQPPE